MSEANFDAERGILDKMQRISFLPRVAFVVVQRVASLIANAHHGVLLSTTTTPVSECLQWNPPQHGVPQL